MKCPKCGLINPDDAQRCHCGYDLELMKQLTSYLGQSATRTPEETETIEDLFQRPQKVQPGEGHSLIKRYGDAYRVGKGLVKVGRLARGLGFILGVPTFFVALVLAGGSYLPGLTVTTKVVIALLTSTLAAVPVFLLGELVAALGQVLQATVDTAVNTSPLLDGAQKSQIVRQGQS
jgi:hypothetical protein